MKIALYVEDGLEQIVLTPQTETERGILNKLHDEGRRMNLHRGSFYQCNGGWMRHQQTYYESPYGGTTRDDASTIIVLRPAEKGSPEKEPDDETV